MSKLKEAIETKNIRGIKSSILAYLSSDPLDRSGEVTRAITAVDQANIQLWEPHDGSTTLITEPSKWTKDYFAELQAHLITNFSKEGLQHTLKVGKHAYREELNRSTQQGRPSYSNSTTNSYRQGGQDNTGKFVMAGVAVVAAGIALYLILK